MVVVWSVATSVCVWMLVSISGCFCVMFFFCFFCGFFVFFFYFSFFFQAEDGIRDLVRSRGLGDVYKRQVLHGMETVLGRMRDDGLTGGSRLLDILLQATEISRRLVLDSESVSNARIAGLEASLQSLSLIHI